MTNTPDLAAVFDAVVTLLAERREEFNRLDSENHNHGDHLLAVFQAARQAAAETGDLPAAMARAGELLEQLEGNGSAAVYGRGLQAMAAQFEARGIHLDALAAYLRRHLGGSAVEPSTGEADNLHSGEILKALLNALTGWEQAETAAQNPGGQASNGLDLGYLLGVGMAYIQAKQSGGDRLDVLAETMVSASPLGKAPHRAASGRQVVRAILDALKNT